MDNLKTDPTKDLIDKRIKELEADLKRARWRLFWSIGSVVIYVLTLIQFILAACMYHFAGMVPNNMTVLTIVFGLMIAHQLDNKCKCQ